MEFGQKLIHLAASVLLFAIILEEHVLPRLSSDLVQRLLQPLLLGCGSHDPHLTVPDVFAQLSLAAVERLALLPQFVHFLLVVDLIMPDQVMLLDQPLLVSHLLMSFRLAGDRLWWCGYGGCCWTGPP